MIQGAILRPITERLLKSAGIAEGTRVLDLGCGAGDVSLLAAGLVGPEGLVVGIDPNPDVIAVAAKRAETAGLPQIQFQQASVQGFSPAEPFDLVIGRYLLVHQSDPVQFLRTAARLAKPGGCIAFHEVSLVHEFASRPGVPLWERAGELILAAAQSALPHYDVTNRLIARFSEAGLGQPDLFCETPIGGGPDSPLYAWLAETLRSFQPHLKEVDTATGESIAVEDLERGLREAVVTSRSQVMGPAQVCAWARV